jgi:hypothetical protein
MLSGLFERWGRSIIVTLVLIPLAFRPNLIFKSIVSEKNIAGYYRYQL